MAEKDVNEIVRKIRTELRLAMNGVVATSMREKGMNYRMNFGVDIPKLRQIALNHTADNDLAQVLWQQDVRELKILATLLYPVGNFTQTLVEEWVKAIPNQEIREQVCMNLFQKTAFADALVHNWVAEGDEEIRTTGFWLFARLVISRSERLAAINTDMVIDKAVADVFSPSVFLRQAALNALKFAGRTSEKSANDILHRLRDVENHPDAQQREIFDSLRFEFGYD